MILRSAIIFLMIFISITCSGKTKAAESSFFKYWNNQGAEISTYRLLQNRYGEVREGKAVLIFVKEPFLPDKQVKADPSSSQKKAVSVLKLNAIHRFVTGIYDYSLMKSVFSPVDYQKKTHEPTLKVSATQQDWCGHVFSQFNRRKDHYHLRWFSYFEAEGDEELEIKDARLEDSIWTWIRVSPETLPIGSTTLIPGVFFGLLHHITPQAEEVDATLKQEGEVMKYTLHYPRLRRRLTIEFESHFPHRITEWEEAYRDSDRHVSASRLEILQTDYWNKNTKKDLKLREKVDIKESLF